MIYVGLRIKTPSEPEFIKKIMNYKKDKEMYSFFYNHRLKNEEKKYEVKERYVIYINNIEPRIDSEIIVTEILECRPEVMRSKDGREYLNCVVTINATNVEPNEEKLPKYKDLVNNTMKEEFSYQAPPKVDIPTIPQKQKPKNTYQSNNNFPFYSSDDELGF